jgi:hypothetical protein
VGPLLVPGAVEVGQDVGGRICGVRPGVMTSFRAAGTALLMDSMSFPYDSAGLSTGGEGTRGQSRDRLVGSRPDLGRPHDRRIKSPDADADRTLERFAGRWPTFVRVVTPAGRGGEPIGWMLA